MIIAHIYEVGFQSYNEDKKRDIVERVGVFEHITKYREYVDNMRTCSRSVPFYATLHDTDTGEKWDSFGCEDVQSMIDFYKKELKNAAKKMKNIDDFTLSMFAPLINRRQKTIIFEYTHFQSFITKKDAMKKGMKNDNA